MQAGREDLLALPDYQLVSHYCRDNKNKGGSCILVRKGIQCKDLFGISKLSVKGVFECCAVELTDLQVVVACVYRVPKKKQKAAYLELFYDRMTTLLNELCIQKHRHVIICGDFNINILENNKQTREFNDFLLGYNLSLALSEITRPESGTCLDNFAHNVKRGCKCEVLDLGLSDHTAQLLKCPVRKTCIIDFWKTKKRIFSKENLATFRKHLKCLSFSETLGTNDPDKSYNNFLESFLLLYNLCFPYVDVKIKLRKKLHWLSSGIKKCSKRQRQLLWQWRTRPSEQSKKIFENYSKRLKRIIKLTQQAQNNNTIKNATNKSKSAWNIINKSKVSLPNEPIRKLKLDDSEITDPLEIAEAFNNFFIDQIKPIREGLDGALRQKVDYQSQSIFIRPATSESIIKMIGSLKNKNSVGYDGIHTKVLKYVSDIIAKPLSHILNACIEFGKYPDKLKPVIVKPLFKKENKELMKYYRPVALLSVVSKIFEKYLYHTIVSYLERFNILTEEQKGFRKGKSINMAVYEFLEYATTSMDERKPIVALYMDMTKAFDYVNHELLIGKLQAYGIRGNILNLIKSYLSNRSQSTEISRICVGNKRESKYISNSRLVKCGVPQGSVLGPLLFIIYINDLPKNVAHPMTLFADDSTVIIKCNESDDNETKINDALKEIINWMNNNNLLVNLEKTYLMNFYQNASKLGSLNIEYNGIKINEIKYTKFLGLIIDSKLDWKQQTKTITNKLSKYAYLLSKLSKILSEENCLTAYHGFVASTLRYGIIFWGNSTDREIILRAQKRCIRAMCKLKSRDSCKPYFKNLRLLTVPSLYIFEAAVFVKLNPGYFVQVSTVRYNHVRTQYRNMLSLPKCNTALFKKSVFYMAPLIYNKVPNNIKEMPINLFKRGLFALLVDKCYYRINEFLEDKSI